MDRLKKNNHCSVLWRKWAGPWSKEGNIIQKKTESEEIKLLSFVAGSCSCQHWRNRIIQLYECQGALKHWTKSGVMPAVSAWWKAGWIKTRTWPTSSHNKQTGAVIIIREICLCSQSISLPGDPSHNQPPNPDSIAYASKILLKGPWYSCLVWGYACAWQIQKWMLTVIYRMKHRAHNKKARESTQGAEGVCNPIGGTAVWTNQYPQSSCL